MQDKKIEEFVLITVPKELSEEIGITENSVLQIYADGNRLVIERLTDTGEIVCDGDCEDCPCYKNCEEEEK